MQPATKNILSAIPAQVPAAQDPRLPRHFFAALNSGWAVVSDSFEVHNYHGRWSGRLLLSSGTVPTRLSVSFTASDGGYRFAAPEVARS
jgi:hypothetical protein